MSTTSDDSLFAFGTLNEGSRISKFTIQTDLGREINITRYRPTLHTHDGGVY